MNNRWKSYVGAVMLLAATALNVQAQARDTIRSARRPVYHVNYWVDLPIIAAGGAGGIYEVTHPQPNITDAELNALNPNNVPSFDRIALHQKMSLVPTWDKYASVGQIIGAAMPLAILLDPDIRADWLPVLTIGLEVNMVTVGIYGISPLGPTFIHRFRPLNYYPAAEAKQYGINQHDGFGRQSWYSGHVASVTASSFFIAKVYCDYHPDANPYLVYGLAAVPSLGMSVIRFMTLDHFPSDLAMGLAVGVACGVVIPQLHRIDNDNVTMGFFSSPDRGTGVSFCYSPSN